MGGCAIILKSPSEIEIMREANQIVAETLGILKKKIAPGVSTLALDKEAERFVKKKGGKPAFKGYRGFPCSLCVSINDEVVHGIPSGKVLLRDGDIVSIDFGVKYKGFYGDAAITVSVGKITEEKDNLIKITEESLYLGIAQAVPGNRINDISVAIQSHVEKHKFSVVRQFVGHGIGSQLHEAPEIPNYSRKERTPKLLPGMVLAIEPMVNAGKNEVWVLPDGWTVVTKDGTPSAHFEHSIVITEDGPKILSQTV